MWVVYFCKFINLIKRSLGLLVNLYFNAWVSFSYASTENSKEMKLILLSFFIKFVQPIQYFVNYFPIIINYKFLQTCKSKSIKQKLFIRIWNSKRLPQSIRFLSGLSLLFLSIYLFVFHCLVTLPILHTEKLHSRRNITS